MDLRGPSREIAERMGLMAGIRKYQAAARPTPPRRAAELSSCTTGRRVRNTRRSHPWSLGVHKPRPMARMAVRCYPPMVRGPLGRPAPRIGLRPALPRHAGVAMVSGRWRSAPDTALDVGRDYVGDHALKTMGWNGSGPAIRRARPACPGEVFPSAGVPPPQGVTGFWPDRSALVGAVTYLGRIMIDREGE